ncbi:MAG: hypothetical protein EOO88_47775 [Pedobacter sp.]|nr:MAG: hypothetical protein EOO88_47775 [Pedobacter sp.]
MLGRWDVQKGRALEKEYQAAERVVLEITEYIVGNQLIWMSFEEAKGIVMKWHSLRNTGVEIDALLDRVFVSSGIFIVDDWSGTVSFRHRSFGEYLYARAAKARGKAIPKEHAFDGYWGACTFFYIGLLGDCQDLLTDLYNAIPSDESETWRKILSLPNYSLAGYQTEYAVVENNLFKLFIEAAKLYEKVRTGETFTKLNSLPEMHLLWLFQRVIRGSYDYNFLKPAITQTIISIDESKTTPKEKFVALFFASCFASQLDDSSGFTYILENYPIEQIPVTVALGIQIETKYNAEFYKLPLVKAHEKRLYKLLFPNHRSKPHGTKGIKDSKLSDLFDKPLKSRRLED